MKAEKALSGEAGKRGSGRQPCRVVNWKSTDISRPAPDTGTGPHVQSAADCGLHAAISRVDSCLGTPPTHCSIAPRITASGPTPAHHRNRDHASHAQDGSVGRSIPVRARGWVCHHSHRANSPEEPPQDGPTRNGLVVWIKEISCLPVGNRHVRLRRSWRVPYH